MIFRSPVTLKSVGLQPYQAVLLLLTDEPRKKLESNPELKTRIEVDAKSTIQKSNVRLSPTCSEKSGSDCKLGQVKGAEKVATIGIYWSLRCCSSPMQLASFGR